MEPLIEKAIYIGDDVWIGANCTITSGVTISSGAIVAANSVVTCNVGPNEIVAGCPAKFKRNRLNA
jgi:maltose O-acetyltransferase